MSDDPSPNAGEATEIKVGPLEFRMLVFRTAHAQRHLLHPFMASIGLGTGQPKLLSYLAKQGPCSQRELAEYYELDPAGVSRALDALARKGFVTFEQNEDDRRAKVVTATREGERVACAWDAACIEEGRAMLHGFSDVEAAAFANYLARAHANLRAYGAVLDESRNRARENEVVRGE